MAADPGAPIGVFDSGLGGLTTVRELRTLLPGEDILYFGDTGRVPYGTRGRDTIVDYTRQDIAFLLSKHVKTIIAACGTVSSTYPAEEGRALPVGYTGVVQAAAHAALKVTKTGRVGILGTEATVRSGSYQVALAAGDRKVKSFACACPLFVPLVENGHFAPDDPMAHLAAEEYLGPIKEAGVDTVILGCTHYPLLWGVLERQFGPGVALIDPGRQAALAMRDKLAQEAMLNPRETGGRVEYYVSDEPSRFNALAGIFLPEDAAASARQIHVEKYDLDLILKGAMPGVE
ncbi:glutamate racemase [Ruminococcaceae bacterium OttesenSCG-928-I18]|nr:glutamate racemase [Ruminococcaceae bacterium OttesenSCG-928-I18]